ncbi:PAS domain-containing protein [Uliginosibacterium sp. 31-16]|uniref:PAS domain-containing protein n=1 Tax=Uliginosibacterium sp. 31-16 TaxID=3068315 RepID=UPI00273D8764|nr:PAS domain-containing protein [Uliginosibacterium sp. 31-16]MDP5240375.1 PAS domain-containing protein [Uliginosibacterium sp. 31-16]
MNRQRILAGGLIAFGVAVLAWLLALPGWLAAPLTALLMLLLLRHILQQQEQALQDSLAAARQALLGSALPALLLDSTGHVQETNPAFLALAGLPPDCLPGALWSALPQTWQAFISTQHQQALAGTGHSTETLLPRTQGSVLLRVHAQPLRAPDGARQILLQWENLSGNNQSLDQLLAREQILLTRSQAFVQTLIDVIPQPVYIKRVENGGSHYTQFNTAFCALYNRRREDLVDISTFDLFSDPARASMANQEDLRVLDGMSVFREEQITDEQTGKERVFIVCKQACEDAEGRAVIVGTNIDITPWRMAERNLKLALQREVDHRERVQSFVQRLIDVIPQPVHVKDSHCRYLMVNEAFVRERGRSREELLGKDPVQVAQLMIGARLGTQDGERERALLSLQEDREVLAGETLVKEEHNFHSITGAERFRTVYKGGCLDAEGQPAIVTAFFDVTKWRLAERDLSQALEREKALLERTRAFTRRLIDLIPDEFYVKDADSRYLLANQTFLNHRRLHSLDQIIGRSMEEVAIAMCEANPEYHDQPELLAGAIADHRLRAQQSREEDLAVLAGQNLLKEDHHILPHTGEERFFLVAKTACEDAEGRPVIVCANFNITPLRLAERELQTLKNKA